MNLRLEFLGFDTWSRRPVYVDQNERLWKDVDPRKDREPKLCTANNNAFDEEPLDPIYCLVELRDATVTFIGGRKTW